MKKQTKLSYSEQNQSSLELKKFCDSYNENYKSFVSYTDEKGNFGQKKEIDIDFGESTKGGRINIYWNKIIEGYEKFGLFGFYDANYCKMTNQDLSLTIVQTNNIVVKISLEHK